MIVAEFGSTVADAMFVFHALDDENGIKPFRLARLPVLIFPHDAPALAVLIVKPRLVDAVFIPGCVESVTVTATVAVPTTQVVPLIAPVEPLIDNPLGNPLAL